MIFSCKYTNYNKAIIQQLQYSNCKPKSPNKQIGTEPYHHSKQTVSNTDINKMSTILKFIVVIQKILIILSLLFFIPTSVFVFAPHGYTFTDQQNVLYLRAYSQVFTGFIVNYNANACTFREAVLNNQFCFKRANTDTMTAKYAVAQESCVGWGYLFQQQYIQYCSGLDSSTQILNSYNGLNLVSNSSKYPIFTLSPPVSSPLSSSYHYLPNNNHEGCKFLALTLTSSVQTVYNLMHEGYQESRLLWYYLCAIVAIFVTLLIANQLTDKVNLRKYVLMTCFCLNIALITLIIRTILFYSHSINLQNNLKQFASCFINQQASNLISMSNFSFGVGSAFVFIMGIIALLIFLAMVGQLVAKLLEMKYYSVRDQYNDQGLELSDLKTSLRSRRIKQANSITSSKLRIVAQDE